MFKKLLIAALFGLMAGVGYAANIDKALVDTDVAPISFQTEQNLNRIDRLSAQAVYSDGTPSSQSFDNGTISTATLTLNGSTTTLVGQRIAIEDVALTEGSQWTAAVSSATTASSIINAINGSATLAAIITASSSTAGVVDLVSDAVGSGTTYDLFTSTPYALSWNGDTSDKTLDMIGGTESDISLTGDSITVLNNEFETGLALLYSTAATSSITGLTDQATYYAIKASRNVFQVASSSVNAVAGTEIDLTAASNGGSYTLAPLALSGTPSFKWQVSNDGTNWSDLSVASVTYSGAGSTIWDLGELSYKLLRISYTHPSPSQGGLDLLIRLFGKLD